MDPTSEWIRMKTSRKIMVAVDSSDHSAYAAEFAINQICRPETDTLIIIHVQEPIQHIFPVADTDIIIPPEVYEDLEKAAIQSSKELVAQFTKKANAGNIHSEGFYIQGDPRTVIVDQANEMSIDLLLLGSRGMGPIKRAFLGSVSDYCMHNVSCPVLIVRKPEKPSQDHIKTEKRTILTAIDRSELSKYAFRWAIHEVCRPEEDRVVLLNSLPTPSWAINSEFISTEMIAKMEKEELQNIEEELDVLVKQAKTMKILCEKDIIYGEARENICKEVEHLNPDLLVVGSRGVSKFHRLLLGSVSDYCAHHVKCPILIVKPPMEMQNPQTA